MNTRVSFLLFGRHEKQSQNQKQAHQQRQQKNSVRKLAKIQLFVLLRLKAASERKLSNFLPHRPVASFQMAPSLMQFSSALGKRRVYLNNLCSSVYQTPPLHSFGIVRQLRDAPRRCKTVWKLKFKSEDCRCRLLECNTCSVLPLDNSSWCTLPMSRISINLLL